MVLHHRWWLLLAVVCTTACTAVAPSAPAPAAPTSAAVGTTTVVAVQPAAAPSCTLWQFLGVPQAAQGIGKLVSCVRNRLGTLFPGLEATPAVLAITDPANLQSSNPAVSSAASVKADEDAAPQKVKAIKYLGTVGCSGCYPEVQDALLKALDDCTEEVRLAAVQALRNTACGQCKVCRTKACCSPKVMERLDKVVNDVDDKGCYKEPSPRVRRVARLAMCACGGGVPAAAGQPLEGPEEGPPGPAPAPAPAPAPSTAFRAAPGSSPIVRAAVPPNRVAMRSPATMAEAANQAQARPATRAARPAPQQLVPQQPVPQQSVPQQPEPQPEPTAVPPEQASSAPVTPSLAIAADSELMQPAGIAPHVPVSAASAIEPEQPREEVLTPQAAIEIIAPRTASIAAPRTPSVAIASPPAAVAPAPAEAAPVAEAAMLIRETTSMQAGAGAAVKTAQPRVQPAPPVSAAPGLESPAPAVSVSAAPPVRLPSPVAEAASSPVAVAIGIEPLPPADELRKPEPTLAANMPKVIAPGGQSLPIVMNNPALSSSAGGQAPAKGTGQLAIFQTQAAPRPKMMRNPYVPQQSASPKQDKQEIDLLAGDPNPRARAAEAGGGAQLANWQQAVPPASPGQAGSSGAINDEQLLGYYRRNLGKYCGPADMRWDWMHVRFDSFAAKADAYAAAATLRQAAVEGEIAPALRSYPKTEIRACDWTSADQLPSRAIARALMRMQPGEVSVMMETATGVDVVRLNDVRPRQLTFEQAKERVRQDMLNEGRR